MCIMRWFKVNNIVALSFIVGVYGASRYDHDGLEENNDNFDTSRYKFAYGVEDHKTGDFKMHQEERDGDIVKGEYTMVEADGTLRTVRYTADKHSGFNAVISKAGEARQEITATPSYHHSIKVPPATSHRHPEGMQLPLKRYNQDLSHYAKLYAAKRNKVLENFATDSGAHYQSVNVDNNAQSHYSYNLPQQDKRRDDTSRGDNDGKRKVSTGPSNNLKHVEVYHQPQVFHMQRPQGFRKIKEPVALSLVDHHVYEEVDHDQTRHENQQVPSVEETEWKNYELQGRNNEPYENYRKVFESHFGRFRRNSSDQGAYSYMNFEGDTSNGYELQHNMNKRKSKF